MPACAPAEAAAGGRTLVDVRTAAERAEGWPRGSVHLPRDQIGLVDPPSGPLALVCAAGARARLVALELARQGSQDVVVVEGGVAAWRAAGLAMEWPRRAPLRPDAAARPGAAPSGEGPQPAGDRYDRQVRMPRVGTAGQARLARARVAVVGVGGLGSPAALYLAAAGVGTLRLIDDDRVALSNLHRQVIHTTPTVGLAKVDSARAALAALNPEVAVESMPTRLAAADAATLLTGCDVVVDGADNFAARHAVAAGCRQLGIPHIFGAVSAFEGQVGVFDPGRGVACFRCAFPEAPPPQVAPTCAQAGVLGVLPGLIGLLQATEALKILLGLEGVLWGRLAHFDALGVALRRFTVPRVATCPGCGG